MATPQLSLIRRHELEARTGLSRSAIYARMDPKDPRYDPDFPTPINLSGRRNIAWVSSEVDAWITAQIQRSRAGREPQAS